jgi:hypothetical protein
MATEPGNFELQKLIAEKRQQFFHFWQVQQQQMQQI